MSMKNSLLPTFIIVGPARGGSTSLYWWLSMHPEIFMSPVKETNFFVHDMLGRNGINDREAIPDITLENIEEFSQLKRFTHAGLVSSIEVYSALFQAGQGVKARGEASPAYLYFASVSSKRIFQLLPNCRILITLRDPVERAWSNYKALLGAGREYLEPKVAFLENRKRLEQGWEHFWDYLGLGLYALQVKAFLDVFPREQVGIWLYEDLMKDKQRYYREILRFIGVNDNFLPNFSRENASKRRVNLIKWRLTRMPVIKSLKRIVPKAFRVAMSRWIDEMFGKELRLDPELRSWLLEFYRDDIFELHEMLPELNILRWIETQERKIAECKSKKGL